MAINQWDKGSSNNGPNAHKKGNRNKDSRRDTTAIREINAQHARDVARWQEMTERWRKRCKYTQERAIDIWERLSDYIESRDAEGEPITISGLQLAAGLTRETWERMRSGELDYRLTAYCDTHNIDMDSIDIDTPQVITDSDNNRILLIPYSRICEKALQMAENQTEERLYQKGRVGDIFALKAKHGWQEETSPSTVNQTLVIASEEQARKAIELLK